MFLFAFGIILQLVLVSGGGLLLLYRPKDVSHECVFSHELRYDLSFGMGMSDTITLSYFYQVTATASRRKPLNGCNERNETICIVNRNEYCFTSGVVCDGIKNCGISDWFDERKSECGLPVKKLDIAPVLTVTAVILFVLVAGTHMLLQWLPPLADSFFIFNFNEDNRLYTAPQLKPPEHMPVDIHQNKKASLIPTYSSSTCSEDESNEQSENIARELRSLSMVPEFLYPSLSKLEQEQQEPSRRTITAITNKLLKIVNAKTKNSSKTHLNSSIIV